MRKRIIVTCLLLLTLAVALGSSNPEPAANPPDTKMLQDAAVAAISQFTSQLQTSLKLALSEGGPVNALGVCNVVAPDIQIAHVRDGWFIERVTDKPRNRNNQADSLQLAVLAQFAVKDAPAFVASWDNPEQPQKFRYYLPIRAADVCMNCHGDPAKFQAGVAEKIKELYPDDKAVGYKVGDLRGMFAIEVLWPEGKTYAEKLTAGK
ncbi:MAG: DUF3365 domain-containing protein [candidate division Zixibacteria bacterium]|nr:DUF3365 domain-containing protein [candidate division Zixibacteria bacterium]